MRRKEQGFSLIELLIVVAIVLVITAIAIPNFVRARISANEASAVTSMHAITTSEIGYSTAYPDIGYSKALADLGPGVGGTCTTTAACFLDSALAAGSKSGYTFTYAPDGATPSLTYTINGNPQAQGLSGQAGYFSDQSNVIRYNTTTTASATDPPL